LSVYTRVESDALALWLAPLGVGDLVSHAGIAAGMQNSNYFVETTRGRYVLTLFELIEPQALDFYLRLQAWLAARGVPCPQPLSDAEGRHWRLLHGKPAALLSCLPGSPDDSPDARRCGQLGRVLAELHLAGAGLPQPLPNPCGAAWRQAVGSLLLDCLPSDEKALLADELAFERSQDFSALPRGIIHADLFRDNVLWCDDGRLGGVLDFYFAGEDVLLFDLAVVANDWCADAEALDALCAAYGAVRPLTPREEAAWPAMRRAAALRFWLLRLEARYRPRPGEVVTLKDPAYFRRLLDGFRLAHDAGSR
jgi:homoserine kinase type II